MTPKIYTFNNGGVNGAYEALALTEDGQTVMRWIVPQELYIASDAARLLTDYTPEYVPTDQIKTHAGLQEAVRLANEKADA